MPLQSFQALLAAQSQSSGVVWIALLTLEHASLSSTLRFASPANQVFLSRGMEFQPLPFDVILPPERYDEVPVTTLTMSALGGEVLSALQSLPTTPLVTIEVVIHTEPDLVQYVNQDLEISAVVGTGVHSLTLELSVSRVFSLPFPGINMDRRNVPGIFTNA